jgi:two-component system, NtrC family, response regulator GlrR
MEACATMPSEMQRKTKPVAGRGPLLRQDRRTGDLAECTYRLVVVNGPEAGTEVPLEGRMVLGSQRDADLRLTDPTVSREHVELEARSDGVRVRDLGSTNGTLLGGLRIQEGILERDALLVVGNVQLRIRVEEQPLSLLEPGQAFGMLVGRSAPMVKLLGTIATVAPTDATVLILGETGTGKEVVARSIHAASERPQQPLVTVDCSTLAPDLVESELFGHVKGAFTGASAERRGAFLAADGGTIFLDEIGELPLDVQPKLLRAVEVGAIRRLGEDLPRQVDVRVIAATRRDLEEEARRGRFRPDLYYRLAVITVRLPPLRERREDIPALARHFAERWGQPGVDLPEPLLSRLAHYDWPGNVRELGNVVERALALPESEPELTSAKAPMPAGAEALQGLPFRQAKEQLIDQFTRAYLSHLLETHGGNITEVAEASGIARPYVHELINKFGLQGVARSKAK